MKPRKAVEGTAALSVGIDASNIRVGGSLTHLSKLLEAAQPAEHGIARFVVWGGRATLEQLPDRIWLERAHEPLLDRSLPYRVFWQWRRLPRVARESCQILFVPGGNAAPGFSPLVTMSRNMLPFDTAELLRYGVSLATLRLLLLRFGQARTFRRADGLVFLTEYAKAVIEQLAPVPDRSIVIPHGVDESLRRPPRLQRPLSTYSPEQPFRLLYISIIDLYKHQWHVAEAVNLLRAQGLPLKVDFVGPSYPPALRRLQRVLRRIDPDSHFAHYHGAVAFEELGKFHELADAFVFASSCENMPNILLEAMAAGLPIACANRGPMPEILGDGGVYFDPEQPREIMHAIQRLAIDPELRTVCAARGYERAAQYSWKRCARETLSFIQSVGTSS
jgi:glycosyltransferase involved in cell wall biosynthesis